MDPDHPLWAVDLKEICRRADRPTLFRKNIQEQIAGHSLAVF